MRTLLRSLQPALEVRPSSSLWLHWNSAVFANDADAVSRRMSNSLFSEQLGSNCGHCKLLKSRALRFLCRAKQLHGGAESDRSPSTWLLVSRSCSSGFLTKGLAAPVME